MTEVELKLLLDPLQERALRDSAQVRALSEGRARTETLHSIYYDTADGALRERRIALRLRRIGRKWVQTVKKANGVIMNGLSTPHEIEFPVRGQTLSLDRIPDDDLRETLIGHAQEGLVPAVETRFRRTRRVLRMPNGARIEMAIDVGELVAGDETAPLAEAEFELLEGDPADLYAAAEQVFTRAPVRFAQSSKSERAIALARTPEPEGPRKARKLSLSPDQTVEHAAIEIFAEGLGHFTPNLADLLQSDAESGPHQTRVALRRLRSALKAFRPVLGTDALAPWEAQARAIAAEAGRLRDLDVLIGELAPKAAPQSDAGTVRLMMALEERRLEVRLQVRATLSGPEATRFGFGFAGFLAGRGWLNPADHNQTVHLAQPLGPYAAKILHKRWKAVRRYGARMSELTIEERHEMRKELKKFRYLLDAFRTLCDPDRLGLAMRQIKDLQTAFGALNDQAMAEMMLTAPDAPGADDPAAQRAAGRLIGYLEAEADRLWPEAVAGWEALSASPRPWKY